MGLVSSSHVFFGTFSSSIKIRNKFPEIIHIHKTPREQGKSEIVISGKNGRSLYEIKYSKSIDHFLNKLVTTDRKQ